MSLSPTWTPSWMYHAGSAHQAWQVPVCKMHLTAVLMLRTSCQDGVSGSRCGLSSLLTVVDSRTSKGIGAALHLRSPAACPRAGNSKALRDSVSSSVQQR